jgi:phosphoribosylformimino-5-aminoimidazole carboxamide ribotide isomerase
MESLRSWFDLGLDRLVLGTAVCENPSLVEKACSLWPGRVAAALDASGSRLKVWGWRLDGGRDLFETAASLKEMGLGLIVYTDVDRDGTQNGPNIETAAQVASASGLPTIISGGISGLSDLVKIKEAANPLFHGVISGKALYEGTLDYAQGRAVLSGRAGLSSDAQTNP